MYRESALRDPKEAPPAELVCEGVKAPGTSSRAFATLRLMIAPVSIAYVFAFNPVLSVGGATAAFLVSYFLRRRVVAKLTVLRVDAGEVVVSAHPASGESLHVRLGAITDVVLDTKSEESLQLDASPIPALKFANARPGPSVDRARVMLIVDDHDPIAITPMVVSYGDATDQLGKVRVFLRSHGWLPEDEREAEGS